MEGNDDDRLRRMIDSLLPHREEAADPSSPPVTYVTEGKLKELLQNAHVMNTPDYLKRLLLCVENLSTFHDCKVFPAFLEVIEAVPRYMSREGLNECMLDVTKDEKGILLTSKNYPKFWQKITEVLPPTDKQFQTLQIRVNLGLMLNIKRTLYNLMQQMILRPGCRKPIVEVLSFLPGLRNVSYSDELVVPSMLVHLAKDVAIEKATNVTDEDFRSVVQHFCFHRKIVSVDSVLDHFTLPVLDDPVVAARCERLLAEGRLAATSGKLDPDQAVSTAVLLVNEERSVVQRGTLERSEATIGSAVQAVTTAGLDSWLNDVTDGPTKELFREFFEEVKKVSVAIVPDPGRAFAEKRTDEIERLFVWHFGNRFSQPAIPIGDELSLASNEITRQLSLRGEHAKAFVQLLEMETVLAAVSLMDDSDKRKRCCVDLMASCKIKSLLEVLESSGCSERMKQKVEGWLRNLYRHLGSAQKVEALSHHKRLQSIRVHEPETPAPMLNAEPCQVDNELKQLYQEEAVAGGFSKNAGTKRHKSAAKAARRRESAARIGHEYSSTCQEDDTALSADENSDYYDDDY